MMMGTLQVRTLFGVVKYLALHTLPGSVYIDCCMKQIFPIGSTFCTDTLYNSTNNGQGRNPLWDIQRTVSKASRLQELVYARLKSQNVNNSNRKVIPCACGDFS